LLLSQQSPLASSESIFRETNQREGAMPIDPVCKMEVSVADAAASHDHHSETLYFCSIDCLKKFEADPAKYMDNMSDEELIA
jgi:YHS domain-containing protein